ncbi:hypothetical protein POX_e06773 [Penicillium oxalicum]|uniref:hypothetical protein n=1 Tax=Penicillium oxalicum TaxID=69781 RepID=UPI0020B7CA57|nr:hypothetical protein POX_e06773 [Penicillium oxalicum]KAI2788752.1 hypothetical protein POX_e06773 [Penicillium oxalicum]
MTLGPIGSHPALPSAFRIQTHRLSNIPPPGTWPPSRRVCFLVCGPRGAKTGELGDRGSYPKYPVLGRTDCLIRGPCPQGSRMGFGLCG